MIRRFYLILLAALVLAGTALVLAGQDAPEEPAGQPVSAEADATTPEVSEELMGRGRSLYHMHCSSCHGADGTGAQGPSFHGNPDVGDAGYLIDMVLYGGSFMTPFRQILDDDEVATVLTFVRNSWGNEFAPVTAEDVAQQR